MAAHPLPEQNGGHPAALPNAVTALEITLYPDQTIDWQNDSSKDVIITMQAMNNPLTEATFKVPAKQGTVIGTHENAVLPDAHPGTYTFTRSGGDASGRIIIKSGIEHRLR